MTRTTALIRVPFAAAFALAFLTVPLPPPSSDSDFVILVVAAALAIAAAAIDLVLHRMEAVSHWLLAAPAYVSFVVIGLLRHAEGGAASGFGALVLLPLTLLALETERRQLLLGLGAMTVMFIVPILAFAGPEYPTSEWRRVLMWLIVGPIATFTIQRLVREVRAFAASAERLSLTDPLTGLANRRELESVLVTELARAERSGRSISIAMIDIDHFKRYNDTHGHAAGDELLSSTAAAWSAAVRAGDLVARYGGEEFTVVLPETDLETAVAVADRLRRAVPSGQTCSIGVAQWSAPEQPADVIARADAALYEAKRAGRDRVERAASVASG